MTRTPKTTSGRTRQESQLLARGTITSPLVECSRRPKGSVAWASKA